MNKNKGKNNKDKRSYKPISSNKGNSMSMDTLRTTATDKNPNPNQ
jgi:hypothetical protein